MWYLFVAVVIVVNGGDDDDDVVAAVGLVIQAFLLQMSCNCTQSSSKSTLMTPGLSRSTNSFPFLNFSGSQVGPSACLSV